MLYYPARRYIQVAIKSTKVGKKMAVPKAWWTPDAKYAKFIDKGRARGGSVEFAVPVKKRTPEPIAGRGFARNTWKPIARRLRVGIHGTNEEYAAYGKRGRFRVMRRMAATNRRGLYADYDIKEDGSSPHFIFTNHSEAVINQDSGSKGMPPRNIHAKGMRAAEKQLEKELERMGMKMERDWVK